MGYIREPGHGVESGQAADRFTTGVESRPAIKYILGGQFDDQYQSKRQQRKLLRAATIKARVNIIHAEDRHEETKLIDGPISFPYINSNRIIVPHYDALVLTLCMNDFNVHEVLVDPGSVAYLLQLTASKQMKLSLSVVNSVGRIVFGFNGATTVTLGDIALLVKSRRVTQQILFSIVEDLGPHKAIMAWVWPHLMKAIPSTYHQTVNYLTYVGQVDLFSSQLAAWQCYQLFENKEGRKSLKDIPFKIKPPRRNHSSPPRLGQKRKIRWLWIPWKKKRWTGRKGSLTSVLSCLMKKGSNYNLCC